MNPDFLDMLSALSEEGAEYLLVGAYALAVYGLPRATGGLWGASARRFTSWRRRTSPILPGWKVPAPSSRQAERNGRRFRL